MKMIFCIALFLFRADSRIDRHIPAFARTYFTESRSCEQTLTIGAVISHLGSKYKLSLLRIL